MLCAWIKALFVFFVSPAVLALSFHDDVARATVQGVEYTIIQAQPRQVRLLWQDVQGQNYATLRRAKAALEQQGETVKMLMNAGIFGMDGKPAGLWIEQGVVRHPLNTLQGKGNFHIQPNGVFWLAGNKAGIETRSSWQKAKRKVDYAVQSGPMLVLNGKINSRFVKNLSSPYKRNAVCLTKSRQLLFIISTSYEKTSQWPSLYQFAQALQSFACYQALYLDGSISDYYLPHYSSGFHWKSFVGMIAVTQ